MTDALPTKPSPGKKVPTPPRLDTARALARRLWLNPTEDGLRGARRSLVRRMWQARRCGAAEHRAELRRLYEQVCEQQRSRDWDISLADRRARSRAQVEPHQVMREQVQRQGGGRAAPWLNVMPDDEYVPPAPRGRRIYHQPAPGTAPPQPGSLALVAALRRGDKPRRAARPSGSRLNDEFEHYVVIGARTSQAAQREYWRHVANRTCLAILADNRLPAVPPRPSAPSSAPPSSPPRPMVGGDVFLVQAEAIQLTIGGRLTQTQPLVLEMLVSPEQLSVPARLSLQTLREWPAPQTADPLFKYRRGSFGFERRSGLPGDMITLFEELLRPHAAELLGALGLTP